MSRKGLNKNEQELYVSWEYICKKSFWPNHIAYEGIPYDPNWRTFEGFVKDNWFRAYRAKIKWKNYQRVAPRNGIQGKLKTKTTRFVRYKKELGFFKENTCFTSPSDVMKFHRTTHKYMFEGSLLGTRDIKNILRKRGVDLEMETIVKRLKKGVSLFEPSERYKIKWKGKFRSYVEVAEMEGVDYDLLKSRCLRHDEDIQKAINYCRKYDGYPTFDFEGQQLRQFEICEILSERTNITLNALRHRFQRFGMNIELLTSPLGAKPTIRKVCYAIKDGRELRFDSLAQASEKLNLFSGNISQALNGHSVHCGGYKFRFDGGVYNSSEIVPPEKQLEAARDQHLLNVYGSKALVDTSKTLYLLNKKIKEINGSK